MPASQQNPTGQAVPPNIDITSPYTPRRPAPILSLSINHPIGKGLRKLKNFLTHKQTLFSTTFSIKVTPIVAMVSLFGVATLFSGGLTTAYKFGRTMEQKFLSLTPSPTPKIIIQEPDTVMLSRAGTIQATYQYVSPPTFAPPIPTSPSLQEMQKIGTIGSILLASPTPTPAPTIVPSPTPAMLHYVLVDNTGSLTLLKATGTSHLKNYLNLRVLITGSYQKSTNTLSIAKETDIEILQ